MANYLTPEQRHVLEQNGGKPVPVVDPVTGAVCFLVAADLFGRIKPLLGIE